MTVRELLEALDLNGESTEEVYILDNETWIAVPIIALSREYGKLMLVGPDTRALSATSAHHS
jgi:hypothetical protein